MSEVDRSKLIGNIFSRNSGVDCAQAETRLTPEQKKILDSAVKFTEYLVSRWPQVDNIGEKQKLNYYIVGSLATMLLSRGESVVEFDPALIPDLSELESIEIPEESRKILSEFSRKIGDLDYVPSDTYKLNPNRLKKGGGGPSFDDIPENAQAVLKKQEGQMKLMCDPVPAEDYQKHVARIKVDGQDFYIASPETMLAYKVIHALESYSKDPVKFNNDFRNLYQGLVGIYGQDRLIEMVKRVLVQHKEGRRHFHEKLGGESETFIDKIPQIISDLLNDPQISAEIRFVLEAIK